MFCSNLVILRMRSFFPIEYFWLSRFIALCVYFVVINSFIRSFAQCKKNRVYKVCRINDINWYLIWFSFNCIFQFWFLLIHHIKIPSLIMWRWRIGQNKVIQHSQGNYEITEIYCRRSVRSFVILRWLWRVNFGVLVLWNLLLL